MKKSLRRYLTAWRYIYDTQDKVDEQLLRGGLDLAAYFNSIFAAESRINR